MTNKERTCNDNLSEDNNFYEDEKTQEQTSFKTTLFPLGQLRATPGALKAVEREDSDTDAWSLLKRHRSGDWGDLSDTDKKENELSITEGFRIFSAYLLPGTGVTIWVITEADRSATTLLLPEEY